MERRMLVLGCVLALGAVLPVAAQVSTSYKLTESVLDAGGRPENGVTSGSASYRLSFDAIGEAVAQAAIASGSFRIDAGFVAAHPPPGEVANLRLDAPTTLTWNAERSVGSYNLYRGGISTLPALGYGTCESSPIAGEAMTDAATPVSRAGFFYLVTAENRLAEEGTKGTTSAGVMRLNPAPCP